MVSGVSIVRISPGDGYTYPKPGDIVSIRFSVTSYDGKNTLVDSGETFTFPLGMGVVIPAWDNGIPQLSLNETALILAPADLAYGKRGFLPLVPPDTPLGFRIRVVGITRNTKH